MFEEVAVLDEDYTRCDACGRIVDAFEVWVVVPADYSVDHVCPACYRGHMLPSLSEDSM